ncbi:MAG: 1-acyl-sn-glycerol-3-phosphate acyltransferase [Prolixibacteraceae bacterium]|nr:1-acyl-sn-glycerol-3-phosphate acyltransferase [Prolixibacteraceae bacterium]MBN2774862.1 1-acyl-sn-glycerol-3-phosphate acyltransferase [Prolixibacteraceae bacterium]
MPKYFDLKSIFRNSESPLLKKMPGFIISIISGIIYEKRINHIIEKYKNFDGVAFLPKIVEELKLKVEIEGLENLPETGKCFFVANHPFGFIDGLILTNTVGGKYGTLKAIGNDAFNYVPNLRPLVTYVNVYGRTPKDYIKILDEVYNSDSPITHFPEGQVSRKYNGKIQDNLWQKSFITKSVSCGRDIVPFYYYGRNSRLFYFIYSFRNFFGIKTNLELILLPHEMFRKKGETIRVRIGKPIPWQTFDKRASHKDWAEKLRKHVYKIGQAPSADLEFIP